MKEEQNDSIINLIVTHLTGEASVEEERKLLEWKDMDSDNELLFEQYVKLFKLTQKSGKDQDLDINIDNEWEHFLDLTKKEADIIALDTNKRAGTNWLRIAAVISILVVAGVVANYFLLKSGDIVIQTALKTQNVTLPDGTHVDLNHNTRLAYSDKFGETTRSVKLSGEGFFQVTADKNKPFVIEVNDTRVQVLGTKFNVSGYEQNENIEVVVEEGLVGFSSNSDIVELSAGERGVYSKTSQQLSETPNEDINFISWKTRKIVFVESKLPAVIETLNKVYGDRITIVSDISDSCEVTVTFNRQSLEAVLNVLKTTLNLTFRTIDDRIEIVDAECE